MSKECFSVEYPGNINYKSENIGLCKFYPKTIEGYKQAVQDLKVYKAHQSKHIEELEHRLSNSIEPKFTIGQEVWGIDIVRKDNIDRFIVREICYCADYGLYYKTDIGVNIYEYYFKLFATEAEAKKHLEELKNG